MKISQHQLCTHFTPALIHATFHDEPRAPRAGTPIAVVLRVFHLVEVVDVICNGSDTTPLGLVAPCGKRGHSEPCRQRRDREPPFQTWKDGSEGRFQGKFLLPYIRLGLDVFGLWPFLITEICPSHT